jgi:hypothetical protein
MFGKALKANVTSCCCSKHLLHCARCTQSPTQVLVIPFHIHIYFKVAKEAGSLHCIISFYGILVGEHEKVAIGGQVHKQIKVVIYLTIVNLYQE